MSLSEQDKKEAIVAVYTTVQNTLKKNFTGPCTSPSVVIMDVIEALKGIINAKYSMFTRKLALSVLQSKANESRPDMERALNSLKNDPQFKQDCESPGKINELTLLILDKIYLSGSIKLITPDVAKLYQDLKQKNFQLGGAKRRKTRRLPKKHRSTRKHKRSH